MKKNVLLQKAIKQNTVRKRGRLWKKVVSALALLVVFCTVYALVLPAITVSDDPICGLEVHEHSEGCYRTQIAVPECPADLHTHDGCEDGLGNFTCGFGQVLLHKHDALCYDALQNLICPLEERSEHLHTDGCYETTRVLTCPEEGHNHIDDCYLIKQALICQLDQVAVHTHTADCRDAEGNLTCGITPAAVHIHDEVCFSVIRLDTPELICQLEAHAHNEACYVDAFGASNGQEFRCGFGSHVHTDSCKENCSVPEHTHDASCKLEYYDPSADLESAADWEATFENVQLTGNWRADILAIAQTQIGYHESQKNAYLWGDGILRGYTRYGQWYGAPYIDWSAAFVSFCVHYAGAEAVPQDSSCASYMSKMELAGLLHKPGYYLPNPGDLVFFSNNGATADHMGIVAELLPDATGELSKIKVLAGDSEDQVQYVTYDLMDAAVLGYGEITEGDPLEYICGNDDHEHSPDCYQWTVYYTDDNMMVQATIQGVEALPENLSLAVKQVTKASDPLSHTAMSAALHAQIAATPYFMSETGIYRMDLLSDGTVYALPDDAKVNVKVTFTQPIFSPKAVKNAAKLQTFLLTQGNTASTFAMRTAPAASYLAEAMTDESYENAQHGVTGLEFSTTQLGSFAVVLSNSTMTGSFWTRVTSTSELAAGGTFMIVSAEGNYALRGDNSNNYVPVTLEAVKGNTQYYTITSNSTIDSNLYWSFTGSGSKYVVKNLKTGSYVAPGRVKTGGSWLRPTYTNYTIQSSSANLTLSYHSPENGWRFQNGEYYLNNPGTGAFGITNTQDGRYGSTSVYYYYTRDMLIFKLSDVTALEIPKDVVLKDENSSGTNSGPAKPDYGDFIIPSTSQTGDTDVTDSEGNSVSGNFYSDPSTSDIETQFRQDSFEASQVIDGKVVTDKSVIYGMDNYGAFSDYAKNTFSVTLSTLGQEYPVPKEYQVKIPVDVMFVLDVSGSMSSNASDSGQNEQRAIDMAKAVNDAIGHIMDDHPANRIGIVLYSGGAWEMLPLSRYTATNGQYVTYQEKTVRHDKTGYDFTITYVLGSSSLKDQYTKQSYANAGNNAVQGIGTYTQAGIAMGHKVFSDIGTDTTYTAEFDDGHEITVKRQPVFILLSDGEPTYSTNVYNDVLNGPHYGDGNAASENGKGIHGFNTILSANYYKRMVGIQYNQPALFYTVGVGISETSDDPLETTSHTSDTYKRAVLNPTKQMITNLSSKHTSASYTVDQLRSMLLETFDQHYVPTRSEWPETWTGIPHKHVPVLRTNPYADNYSYADGAYFGDLDEDALLEIFDDIYLLSSHTKVYGFILYKDSSVDIVDRIGQGMEIKGTPVLRYGGINYTEPQITVSGNVTTYTYQGTYTDPYIPNRSIDLSKLRITVTKESDGTQTVDFYVPDVALPTYTPELIGLNYYYESLPVRLIYQVGLTAESEQAVLNLQTNGGKLTFYTNQWGSDDLISTSTLLPSTANPFYYRENGLPPYQPHHSLKSEDTTGTADYHVDCTRTIETHNGEVVVRVIHKQGNNGKLVFEAEGIDIPVEKVWDGVDADLMNPVEITLYKVTDVNLATGGIRRYAEPVATGSIDRNNDWAYVFQGVSTPNGDWYYAIAESVPAGYRVSYAGEKIDIILDDNSTIAAAKVDTSDPQNISVTITNSPGTILPATGGFGSLPYTLGGLMLMLTAAAVLLYRAIRRKEEHPSF